MIIHSEASKRNYILTDIIVNDLNNTHIKLTKNGSNIGFIPSINSQGFLTLILFDKPKNTSVYTVKIAKSFADLNSGNLQQLRVYYAHNINIDPYFDPQQTSDISFIKGITKMDYNYRLNYMQNNNIEISEKAKVVYDLPEEIADISDPFKPIKLLERKIDARTGLYEGKDEVTVCAVGIAQNNMLNTYGIYILHYGFNEKKKIIHKIVEPPHKIMLNTTLYEDFTTSNYVEGYFMTHPDFTTKEALTGLDFTAYDINNNKIPLQYNIKKYFEDVL